MSALHDPRLRAPALLELGAGLRSMIDRLDRLLVRYAPGGGGDDGAGPLEPCEVTEIVLGLVALRDAVERRLPAAAAPAAEEREHARQWTEGLLR